MKEPNQQSPEPRASRVAQLKRCKDDMKIAPDVDIEKFADALRAGRSTKNLLHCPLSELQLTESQRNLIRETRRTKKEGVKLLARQVVSDMARAARRLNIEELVRLRKVIASAVARSERLRLSSREKNATSKENESVAWKEWRKRTRSGKNVWTPIFEGGAPGLVQQKK